MNWKSQTLFEQPDASDSKPANPDNPISPSGLTMLGLCIKELGFDDNGKKGGQFKTIEYFQELAKKYKIQRGISKSSVQRNIKASLDRIKEISTEDDICR